MTTTETTYPVTVYDYAELIKARYGFDDVDGTYVPRITLGAGSGTGDYGKTFIYKETDGFYIDYYNSVDGTKYTIKITDDGIDFGGFPTVTADALHNLWVQSSEPTGAKINDVWVDTDDPFAMTTLKSPRRVRTQSAQRPLNFWRSPARPWR
jgi:hypothetical protein